MCLVYHRIMHSVLSSVTNALLNHKKTCFYDAPKLSQCTPLVRWCVIDVLHTFFFHVKGKNSPFLFLLEIKGDLTIQKFQLDPLIILTLSPSLSKVLHILFQKTFTTICISVLIYVIKKVDLMYLYPACISILVLWNIPVFQANSI